MLIPSTLFFFILNSHGLSAYPTINMWSIVRKRAYANKSPEKKAEFCAMRSRVQKKVFSKRTAKEKRFFHKRTSESKQAFWDNISQDDKNAHIKKMSTGMKKAWDDADENFGSLIANIENRKKLFGDFKIEKDIPRINDYAGVVTMSDMRTL